MKAMKLVIVLVLVCGIDFFAGNFGTGKIAGKP